MENYMSAQIKTKGTPTNIAGNPYALLDSEGVVTEVVYMQDYSSEQIEETLSLHSYSTYIICSEYGKEIYVGEKWLGDMFVAKKPFESWVPHPITGLWVAPTAYPNDNNEYLWDENTLSWNICEPCKQTNTDTLQEDINAN
jgi:hypothetical protein